MPISKQLNYWIAESGSWQSYVDFKLPEDERASYSFISEYDDLFISLMSNALELIKSEKIDDRTVDILSIAKGLEIFSLKEKREYFHGVHRSNNMLYAAGLYYLANYSASAWILSKIYPKLEYTEEIEDFISSFLKRELIGNNRFNKILSEYLSTGRKPFLSILAKQIKNEKDLSFNDDANRYFSCLLAESIIKKFINDNIWVDLLKATNDRERWIDFVNYNIKKPVPIWSFFPSQRLAIQKGIMNGTTFSLQMPTSSGKTSICELLIYDEFKTNTNCRILYLAPYRALASELKQTLAVNIGKLGISSKTIYGGNLPTVEERSSIDTVNLLIATPEKFMAIEDIFPDISETFTTIICDEGHLLDDESRGLNYELLLSRTRGNSIPNRRFIFVSAIIPNISTINSWLGGSEKSLVSSEYRPTELEYAFLKPMSGSGFYLDVNPHKKKPYNYQLYKYLFADELTILNAKGKAYKITSKKGISVATALKATNSGTVALFAPHKRGNTGVEDLAAEALVQLTNRPQLSLSEYSPKEHLSNLEEYFTIIFGSDYLLTQCSRLGVLFHHGDFPQNIRDIIEDSMREGKIRLVICTNTLAEGVNLPIKTIVIHSTSRFSPYAANKHEPIKLRDLKNLVGRAGRAGQETKGMVIIPHANDFNRINELIRERNVEPVKGQLYNIINLITNYLQRERLPITTETLDSLSEELQELLDSIDISIIDLLAEEVQTDELNQLVSDLITQTLSFYQANASEKQTLNTLFQLRTEKIKPIVEKREFPILKHSGANIRLYDDVISHFNFDDEIWTTSFEALDERWLTYILDNGIFQLDRFKSNLQDFNTQNKCELDEEEIKKTIHLWISGGWYATFCEALDLEMHQILRLINSFISFNIQSVVSVVVRLKELKSSGYTIPGHIANWSSFLQHGIDTQLKLDLIEMGLIDRVGVLTLSDYLDSIKYVHDDYKSLKSYLIKNGKVIVENIRHDLPKISLQKLLKFISRLNIRAIF